MIKKFFHLVCVLITGSIWFVALILLLQQLLLGLYSLNIFSPQTYRIFNQFWDEGGVLGPKEILVLVILILYIPLCLFGWYKIYQFKFLKLLTGPLNWLLNRKFRNYKGMASVNIKNLKIEDKKTIEQVVQERLDQERKKEEKHPAEKNFRQAIIEKIEEET